MRIGSRRKSTFNNRTKASKVQPTAPPPALNFGTGKAYTSGWSDPLLEQLAGEDGQAGTHNPSIWGENGCARLINAVNEAHGVNSALIGHHYRADLQWLDSALEIKWPSAILVHETAQDRLDAWEVAAQDKAALEDEIKEDGFSLPHWRRLLFLATGLFGLLFGDLPIVAKSFELFHLSDKPIIPGFHLTDELHMAGLASVTALIILAHVSGHGLREIAHAFNWRRLAPKDQRSSLPRPSGFSAATVVVCLGFGLLLLQGLSVIRVDYLRSVHQQGNTTAFFDLNLGILSAAVALGFFHANLYGRRWADATRIEAKAHRLLVQSEGEYAASAGEFNGLLDQRDTVVAQAGHHIGASEQDTLRQIELITRRTVLSQPEPTTERLFPDDLPRPVHLEGAGLRVFLRGVAAEPTFPRLDVGSLVKRRQKVRQELRAMHKSPEEAERLETEIQDEEVVDVDDAGTAEVVLPPDSTVPASTQMSQPTGFPLPGTKSSADKIAHNGLGAL
jgi:hypothetical protein